MSVESSRLVEGLAFEIQSHNFKVLSDVTVEQGGKNSAPSPHDYLEISLSSCTAITVQMYANRKGFPLESTDVKVKITAEGASNEILREIKFIGNLTDEQKQRLLVIAEKCPIHKILAAGVKIETRMI